MLFRLKRSLNCIREAYLAIGIVFIIAFAGFFLVGRIYTDTGARVMIEAMLPALRTLCFAVSASSLTVIALLMTVLGFAKRLDNDFDLDFYVRIWFISTIATISLIGSSMLLLMITIPITETDSLRTWYTVVYWIMVILASSVLALLVGTIVSLYRTLIGLISLLAPELNDDATNS